MDETFASGIALYENNENSTLQNYLNALCFVARLTVKSTIYNCRYEDGQIYQK